MRTSPLPYLDEHAITIAAAADDVWSALTEAVDRNFSRPPMATYARAIRCGYHMASGPRPLAEGSTIPGFRVVAAVPGSELVLEGWHHFSTYTLSFHLDETDEADEADEVRCRLRAVSRAAFPGVAGGVYRRLVIGTRGHVILVRRMLSGVKARSESRARRAGPR